MDNALEVQMQSRPGSEEPCCACRRPGSGWHALPIHNGDIVSNEFIGGDGCKGCCEECYERHAAGLMRTGDHYYTAHQDAMRSFINGGGI